MIADCLKSLIMNNFDIVLKCVANSMLFTFKKETGLRKDVFDFNKPSWELRKDVMKCCKITDGCFFG